MSKPELSGKRITRSHADAEWSYRFEIAKRPFKGLTGTTDRREAEKIAKREYDKEKLLAKAQADIGRSPMTFGRACDLWVAEKLPKLAGTGMLMQIDFLKVYISPALLLHKIPASAITRMALARAECLRKGKDGTLQRIRGTTVNQTVDLLQRILNYAAEAHEATVRRYKWSTFRIRQEKEAGQHVGRAIPQAVRQMILGTIQDDYLQITRFALLSGLRATENFLTWPQIGWEEKVASRVYGKGHRQIGRRVNLGRAAMAVLQAEFYRDERHVTHVFSYVASRNGKIGNTSRVMVRGQRYPITYAGWKSAWQRMREKLALQGVRIHDLRHTFATDNVKKVPLTTLKTMMGHADIRTTQGYVSPDEAAICEALDAMPMPMPATAETALPSKVALEAALETKKTA